MRRLTLLLLTAGLAACGAAAPPPTVAPTLGPILTPAGDQARATPALPDPSAISLAAPTLEAAASPRPTSAVDGLAASQRTPTASGDTHLDQYRGWMAEARRKHPYSATVDLMWDVMICESSGNPAIQGPGGLTGLFQYQAETWAGSWNPYRDQPITDARAQIFATAKAWSDGNQQWWGVCLP